MRSESDIQNQGDTLLMWCHKASFGVVVNFLPGEIRFWNNLMQYFSVKDQYCVKQSVTTYTQSGGFYIILYYINKLSISDFLYLLFETELSGLIRAL